MPNIVFIGVSLDGYIADRDGGLDFLQSVENLEHEDFGFQEFMNRTDALLMGRKTYETVVSFGGEWPYSKPVFILSKTLTSLPEELKGRVELVTGAIEEIVQQLTDRGFHTLYIDGGNVIQSCLQHDMIDELIISRIPILLGGGTPLFKELPSHLTFEHVETKLFLNAIVKSHYKRIRLIK